MIEMNTRKKHGIDLNEKSVCIIYFASALLIKNGFGITNNTPFVSVHLNIQHS